MKDRYGREIEACHLCSVILGRNPLLRADRPTCSQCAKAFDAGDQQARQDCLGIVLRGPHPVDTTRNAIADAIRKTIA